MQRSPCLGKGPRPSSEKLGQEVLRLPDSVIDVVAVQGCKDRTLHRVGQLILQELTHHLGNLRRLGLRQVCFFDESCNHFFHADRKACLCENTNPACDSRDWCYKRPPMTARFTPPADFERYEGFIFDCDGTLADTMPAHFVAWRNALSEGGATFEFTWSLFVSRAGMTMERTVIELSEQFAEPLDPNLISTRQRSFFEELSTQIEPIVEVTEFARRLHRRHPIAVASGSSRNSVERTLTAVGVRELFEVIVTPEDVTHGKPSPESFLLAAQRLGVRPERCLVIEDGELGFEAARRAGMDYVVVGALDPTAR